MRFKLIVAMVRPNITEKVIDAARDAGATGDVILSARGSGINKTRTFFGLNIEDQTEVIMFLVEEHSAEEILEAIKTAGSLNEPERGIALVLQVEKVAGMESQLEKLKKQAEKKHI